MFKQSTQKLQTRVALSELRRDLEYLGPVRDGMAVYEYAVDFFNLVTRFNDEYKLTEDVFDGDKKYVELLKKHLKDCNRNKRGMVRAAKGEAVTLDNLYLGNVGGLKTLPASEFRYNGDKKVQGIIQNQLLSVIRAHYNPIINLIGYFDGSNKKPNELLKMFGHDRRM